MSELLCEFDVTGMRRNLVVSFEEDLLKCLKADRIEGFGAFWISRKSDRHPCFAININDHQGLAYVHYFPSDGHPGFHAIDSAPAGCPDKVEIDLTCRDIIELESYMLVDSKTAYDLALQYARNLELPSSVKWFEL